MTTETKIEVATDIEKFLAAKQEITYDTNASGAKIWKQNRAKITKDNAAKILANYGLTIDSYLAAQKAWVDREVGKACTQMRIDDQAEHVRKKVFAECKPLDDNSVWKLIPDTTELNDSDTEPAETESDSKANNVGDLSDKAIALFNSRLVAFRIANYYEKERNQMQAEGYKFILTVRIPELHPYRKFDFKEDNNYYKNIDALKNYGTLRIHDNVWRLKSITGELLAKGIGENDFAEFINAYATAENESASKTADPAPAEDFDVKLAELKAKADNAKRALAKAQADCNKANDNLKNFINEQAYNLKQKLDNLSLAYTITLKKDNGATYRVNTFDNIYISAYRPGFDVEFHFEFWNGKTIARYETHAQIQAVIARLKAAIERGDSEFTFPTVDDLKPQTFEIVPDAEWTSLFGRHHYYRIGDECLTYDKAGRFVEVFNKKLGGYYTSKGEFYYKNKSDNPDAIWEGNRHKCTEQTFWQIMTARADDSLEEAPDAVQVANDYQQTLDNVNAQINADNFDYVAAKEHIENVYEDVQNCIEYWSQQFGLTQKQSEKIYVTLHANADFDNIDRQLRDKLVANAQNENSLERAMEIALKKFQDFCRVKNLAAANRELACYQICRSAFKEVITCDRSGVSATAGRTA